MVCAVDWNRHSCARRGHLTYSPDETELRDRLHVSTPAGEAWRCLRCGDYSVGSPHRAGPAQQAPPVLRGRGRTNLALVRVLAAERAGRGLMAITVAYAVWRFRSASASLNWILAEDLPVLRPLAGQLYEPSVVRAITLAAGRWVPDLGWAAAAVAAYGLLTGVIGVGLWFARRGAAYGAVVTAAGSAVVFAIARAMPGVSAVGLAAAAVAEAASVVYLLASARLFGIRGGGAAAIRVRRARATAEVLRAAQ
ncbi:MAG: hypothetical protein QOD41_2880 [Cryptosporangiaceae bacterium]|nr:hypothetical protein [Cryptosporangiaceae bacterium]